MSKVPMEAVYYFATDVNKQTQIRAICAKLGIRFREMVAEQAQCTVQEVISGAPFAPSEIVLQEELLILHRFSNRKIDQLLSALRRAQVPRIRLKAVVTEHNAHWTLQDLCAELNREHHQIAQSMAEES